MPVVGHGMTVEEVVRSVVAGYRSLEHEPFPEVWHEDILRLLASTGTYWAPQYVQGAPAELLRVFTLRDPAWLDQLAADFDLPTSVSQGLNRNRSTGPALAAWELQAGRLRRAHELGVRLLVGTDNTLGPAALHVEMEAFREAGIAPADVLRMATVEAAAAEGVESWLGTLEVGKLADIVLLEGNPLEDVRNARRPWRVILDGRVVNERDGP